MVNVDKAVVAKLKLNGIYYEVLVDCEQALAFRAGQVADLNEVLATKDIFNDVKKGEHASFLKETFGTADREKIAERIIREGEIQITAAHKNKLREELQKRIVYLIHRNAINPQNGLPHPLQRIEAAIAEARVKLDEFKPAEGQVGDVVGKIRGIIPLAYEMRDVLVKVPAKFTGQSFGLVKQYGKILKEDWESNGNLHILVEIPAGLQVEMQDKLNGLTKGGVEMSVVGRK